MNIDSSRSHAVLLLTLRRSSTSENPIGEESEEAGLGRLYLVDLAGSERNKRSGAEASSQEFGEACAVNASLTTLGRCIQILAGKAKKGASPPFRESKLTRILSPCLGVATTSLVCCVSASAADRSESVCTLEFGRNAMRVVVNPQRAAAVDYRVLAQELQTRLDLTLRRDFDLEAAIYARLSADFHEQLEAAEAARRKAELALHAERRGRTATAGGSTSQCDVEGASAGQALVPMLANLCGPHRTGARGSAEEGLRLSASNPLITPALPSPGSEAAYTNRSPVARALTVACAHDWDDIGLGSLRDSHPPTNAAEQCDVRGECTFASQDARQVLAVLDARLGRLEQLRSPSSSTGNHGSTEELAHTIERLQDLRQRMSRVAGTVAEVLTNCARLAEAHHPNLWQGTAGQLAMSEELRSTRRLAHRLRLAVAPGTDYVDL